MVASHWSFLALAAGIALSAACAGPRSTPGPRAPVVEPAASPDPAPGPAAAEAPEPPAAPAAASVPADGREPVPDAFPEGTRSLELKAISHVFTVPADGADYIGKVTRGTRVAWKRVVVADPPLDRRKRKSPCALWVEIEPSGYLCKDAVTPSREEPGGTKQPVVRAGRLAPDDYYKVMENETNVYKTADDVRAAAPVKAISTKVMVVSLGVLDVDGTPYLKTDHGLVDSAALARFWPSDFEGRKISGASALTWPFAWTFFERGAKKPAVHAGPSVDSERLRGATRREIVPILEERDGFVRIADGEWIDRKFLRVASRTSPPAGVGPGDRWIDVDLDEQVLVAYEGDAPVFATLVSTGGKKNPTPPATYRVRAKAATTPMAGDPSVPNRYEVSGVPWAIRFASGLFVHGVYWHDGFGGPRSHGCVNVSPKDAAFLYEWAGPAVPEGWSEIEVPVGDGMIVRVRDHEHPDPPPFDYSTDPKPGKGRAPRFGP